MSIEVDRPAPRRRVLWIWIFSATGVLAAAAMGFALSTRQVDQQADRTLVPATPASNTIVLLPEQRAGVTTDPVAERDLPVRSAVPGRIVFNANRVTPLFTPFAGRVVRLDADVGTAVREGQVLAAVDSPDVIALQADYQQALTASRIARTSLSQAVRTRERAARLADAEAIPLRELQEAQLAEAHANEEVVRAESAAHAAQGKLQTAAFGDDDIQEIASGRTTATTRLVALRAPVGGTIVERHLGIGQFVQPGGEPLLTVADLSSVWVDADVYEDQLASIRPGAEVSIQTPAYPDETFTARVDRIAATIDTDTRTVTVRCVVANADRRLKPGMFATVLLRSGTITRALTVPASAVVATGNRRAVFVELSPGTYQERTVDVAREVDGVVVIKSGLRTGEQVVTQGGVLLARQLAEARSAQ